MSTSVTTREHSSATTRYNSATSTCLICNTVLISGSFQNIEEWLEDVHVLFKLFDFDEGAALSLTNNSGLSSNPYCINCIKIVKQLNQLMIQLELTQKQIQAYRDEIGQSIVKTFTSTASLGITYQWKRQIFEKLRAAAGSQTERIAFTNDAFAGTSQARLEGSGLSYSSTNYAYQNTPSVCDEGEQIVSEIIDSSVENFENDASGIHPVSEITITCDNSTNTVKPKSKHAKTNSVRRDVMTNRMTQCPFCSKEFSSPLNLARHITLHTGDRPHSCSYCEKTFRDSSNKKRHEIRAHNPSQRTSSTCDICGVEFRCYESMYTHKRYTHLGKKKAGTEAEPSECRICGKIMSNRRNLDTHIRVIHHLQFKTVYCPICGRPGKTVREVQNHQETHKSIWELELEGKAFFYKCTACPQSFPSRSKLSSHQSFEHPGVKFPEIRERESKPHKCPECPNHPGFARRTILKRHITSRHTSHTSRKKVRPPKPKRRFPCAICLKPLRDSHEAKQHELTHDPNRNNHFPLACSKCPPISGLFSKMDEFIKHYETNHPRSPIPKVVPRNAAKLPRNFVCEVCNHKPAFTTRKGLNKHCERGHPKSQGRKPSGKANRKRASKLSSPESEESAGESENEQQRSSRIRTRRKISSKVMVRMKVEMESSNEDSFRDGDEADASFVNLTSIKQYPVVVLRRVDENNKIHVAKREPPEEISS